jgi:hypothetical protein
VIGTEKEECVSEIFRALHVGKSFGNIFRNGGFVDHTSVLINLGQLYPLHVVAAVNDVVLR